MIGEVRTREGMDHAIAFAETGHLVLATLHANNANQAMDRIINFFPEDRRNQLLMDLSRTSRAWSQRWCRRPTAARERWRWRSCWARRWCRTTSATAIHKLEVIGPVQLHEDLRPEPVRAYQPARSATRTHCATPTRRTKCAPAHRSARAATRARCRRAWMGWTSRSGDLAM